jgi:hypothetical protein
MQSLTSSAKVGVQERIALAPDCELLAANFLKSEQFAVRRQGVELTFSYTRLPSRSEILHRFLPE